jgi:aspartate-semialdehyde dehydrogenase
MDFAFFADPAVTGQSWREAREAGASIIDLTYALEEEQDVLVRAPWVSEIVAGETAGHGIEPDLKTPAVVPAHPAATMLALVAGKLQESIKLKSVAATVMEPASEHGRAAMDELHQQTVTLLSFQSLPREQYDAQIAFNLLPSLGEDAKINLQVIEQRIRTHYSKIGVGRLPELSLQVIQAPVFHGYSIAMLIETEETVTSVAVERALAGEHIDIVSDESDPPSNLSATGQKDILVRVSRELSEQGQGSRLWLWLAADNLKLTALNAIACAGELRRLRPQGKVQ